MKTTQLTSPDDLHKLLSRAVTARVESRYHGIDLSLRTLVPFHHKSVHLPVEDLVEFWPEADTALYQLSCLHTLQGSRALVDLLVQTLERTVEEPQRKYWLLDGVFYWHSELQGVLYESTANFLTISTTDGVEHVVQHHVVEQMYPWLLNTLRHIELMGLTAEQTLAALNYYVFNNEHHMPVQEGPLPERIHDIIGIEQTHLHSTHVSYLMRQKGDGPLVQASTSLAELEARFPKITQALLALSGSNFQEYECACHIRHWFSVLNPTPKDALIFDTNSVRFNITQSFKYGNLKPHLTWPYLFDDLVLVQQSDENRTALFFTAGPGCIERRVEINNSGPQSQYLGLEKTLGFIRDMGLDGEAAATALRSAVCMHISHGSSEIPNINLDDYQPF